MRQTIDYTFELNNDGLVSIQRSDGVPLTSSPVTQLGAALAPHGFSTKDYFEIVEELKTTGRATRRIESSGQFLEMM